MPRRERPALGAHVSAAGGFDQALERGEAIGAETIQVFVSSPRSWAVRPPSKEILNKYLDRRKISSIESIYVHGSYLVNLGAADRVLFEKSKKNFLEEFRIANLISAKGFIFHVGSKNNHATGWLPQVVETIKETLKKVPGPTWLILENSAGGGEKIGNQPEELRLIIKEVGSPRLKVCLDTAHAFESGYIPDYSAASLARALRSLDQTIQLRNIVALHINDSKTEAGSRNDRHENIGQGHIGLQGFKNLAKEKLLWHADWLLEIPGFDNTGPDKKNMDIIRTLFK
jgi:deoxyribonuclease-4